MDKMLTLTIVALFCVGVKGLEYGDGCKTAADATEHCRSKNILDPLECVPVATGSGDGTCQCPTNMFRHMTFERCVAPHGIVCTLKAGDGKPFYTCTEFAQCWPNPSNPAPAPIPMQERENGTCRCDPDAEQDSKSGLCKLKHGSTRCKLETDCNVASLLTCDEGKCVCMEESQVFDGTKCKAMVGGKCGKNEPFPDIECGQNMNCAANNICACNDNYTATPEKTCGKPFDGTCDADSDCHPQFICKGTDANKKCGCPDKQEYDSETEQCVLLVGEACSADATENSLECVAHSTCKGNKCTCNDDYVAGTGDREGYCVGLYGSSCNGTTCNTEDFLECGDTTKVCECKADYDKDDQQKKCKGKIEQDCKDNDNCVGNSVCNSGKCGCGNDQEASGDKTTCYQKLGGVCQATTECLPDRHLSCNEGVCSCENPTEMIEQNGACVGLAEKPCSTNLGCVESASCVSQVCKCVSGYTSTEDGKCVEGNGKDSSLSSSMSMMGMIGVMLLGKLI